MPDPISWTLIGLCLLLHFFFSASETALACCNRFKIQVKAFDGSKTAKVVLKILNKYDRALISVLIGSNIVAVLMASISTLLFIKLFAYAGIGEWMISIIASVIVTLATYIIGDALAKTIAREIPDTFSMICAFPVYGLTFLFFPVAFVFEKLIQKTTKLLKQEEEEQFTEEDLEDVVEQVTDEGLIEEEQTDIVSSVLEFNDIKVKEVFTPIEKMFALDINKIDNEKLNELLTKTKYSRIPIYEGDYEHFIGVLHINTYVSEYIKNPNVDVKSILIDPYFVSQNIMLDDLFEGFKKHHTHFAFVTNTRKSVVGMVTMDDVLEELVSDISEPVKKKGRKQ